ncbi:membrane protein [Streptomyces sulfonofaciens]|uniref:Membrane protein n=1 Tax=Streptomyces sulfonofaciens TaxID=68272 RepID=A0A919FS04_9ACTN|nr:endonuclease/exonuclease/phosphatase family protein [Streptomyces sulfonofaciens]GHH70620.1 membrane protein [Streptomyces sulfonofaciens]
MSSRMIVEGPPARRPGGGAPSPGQGRAGRRPHPAAWPAVLLLAAVTAVVTCRITDTDATTPVPQLLAFWPWLIAPTAAALLLAALTRFRTGLVWGLAVLAALAWFMEPYGRVGDPHGPPVAEIRVLASNVQYGRGTPALTGAVRRERPDIVFVEECDSRCLRLLDTAFPAQDRARREGRPGPPGTYPYRSQARAPGAHGSVILSRYPLVPAPALPGTLRMPGATATVHGRPVRLQLAHPVPPLPDSLGRWRTDLAALRGFAAGTAAAHRTTILAGDFNATQDHAAFRRILDTGLRDSARLAGQARTPSWPSRTAPVLGAQLDHVLVSADLSARGARFLGLAGTDHRALLTDLTLHGTPPVR